MIRPSPDSSEIALLREFMWPEDFALSSDELGRAGSNNSSSGRERTVPTQVFTLGLWDTVPLRFPVYYQHLFYREPRVRAKRNEVTL